MSLAPFDIYCAEPTDRFQVRRWLLRAIILSLALHAGLVALFYFTRLEGFRHVDEAPPIDQPMTLWRIVDLPDAVPSEARLAPQAEPAPVVPIPIPTESPRDESPGPLPQPLEIQPPALPHETPSGLGGLDFAPGIDSQTALDDQLRGLADTVMGKSERALSDLQGAEDSTAGLPTPQTLDTLLKDPGPLPAGGAAIDVPGGALFEYNSSDLRPQAIEQLSKLGEFIRRHPGATVSIEGHTDAIGTPEYNQALSEKRGEAVRLWLVQNMGISPERIQTRGFGSSQLRASADGTIEEQQPNRRVEIVIKAGK